MATIITRRPRNIRDVLSIPNFLSKNKRVLIQRNAGGLGDILVHRMLFQDIKQLMPFAEIHFACPSKYHSAVSDHPFIDAILDCKSVDKRDYLISYNTTTPCIRYELSVAPESGMNRADIWAAHCGVTLRHHEMHFNCADEELIWAKDVFRKLRPDRQPVAVVCPVSTLSSKTLLPDQLLTIATQLRRSGCFVVGLHTVPISTLIDNGYVCLSGVGIRQWMSLIQAADYVVSVDTAAYHCAGGMKKPLTGIFTFCDGDVYGKYYDSIIVQRHRKRDSAWTCGPCYDWTKCPKSTEHPLPCLTTISDDMLVEGIQKMFERWPVNM